MAQKSQLEDQRTLIMNMHVERITISKSPLFFSNHPRYEIVVFVHFVSYECIRTMVVSQAKITERWTPFEVRILRRRYWYWMLHLLYPMVELLDDMANKSSSLVDDELCRRVSCCSIRAFTNVCVMAAEPQMGCYGISVVVVGSCTAVAPYMTKMIPMIMIW